MHRLIEETVTTTRRERRVYRVDSEPPPPPAVVETVGELVEELTPTKFERRLRALPSLVRRAS